MKLVNATPVSISIASLKNGIYKVGNNFTNSNVLRFFSPNPALYKNVEILSSGSIFNPAGASIITTGGVNLSLVAAKGIFSAGDIMSSGAISLAAPTVANIQPSTFGAVGASPVMQAATNLEIKTNVLLNQGSITATAGSINASSMTKSGTLAINATGGTFTANKGAISIGAAGANNQLEIVGGDFISNSLNLNSGTATTAASISSVTGLVNLTGGDITFDVAKGTTNLGAIKSTGNVFIDPNNVVMNTETDNGVTINISSVQDVSAGNLSVVDGGDITILSGGSITAGNLTARGGGVTLAAVQNITINGNIDVSADGTKMFPASTGGGPEINGGFITALAGYCLNCNLVNGLEQVGQSSLQPGLLTVNGTLNASGSTALSNGQVISGSGGRIILEGSSNGQLTPPPTNAQISGFLLTKQGSIIDNSGSMGTEVTPQNSLALITICQSCTSINLQNAPGSCCIATSGPVPGYGTTVLDGKISANSANGVGGTINISTIGYNSILSAGAKISANGGSGGGTITIGSADGLSLNLGSISANGGTNSTGAPANGGTISITDVGTGGGGSGSGGGGSGSGGSGSGGSGGSPPHPPNGPTGPITINTNVSANAGQFGNGGSITFSTQGGNAVNVGSGFFSPNITAYGGMQSGNGGTVSISSTSAGPINVTDSTISANVRGTGGGGSAGSGGTINIMAAGDLLVQATSTPHVTISSTGGKGGNGGTLNIQAGGNMTFVNAVLSAQGGDASGTGGSINLKNGTLANGDINFDGTLNVFGQGSAAGTINVTANSGNIIFNNPNAGSVIAGTGSTGATVTMTAAQNITLGNGVTGVGGDINVAAQSGAAGTVQLNAGNNITINDNILVDGLGGNNGGFIVLNAVGNISIGSVNAIPKLSATGGLNGGTIQSTSQRSTTVTNTYMTTAGSPGGNGNGGSISLTAGTGDLVFTGTLIADGEGTGNGGNITISALNGNAVLNNPGGREFATAVSGSGKTGTGGVISMSAFENLTLGNTGAGGGKIDVSSLAQTGNAGSISLTAGTGGSGDLIYLDDIIANGGTTGNGGNILLSQATTSSPMQIGNSNKNGNITADGHGSSNLGGSIAFQSTGSGDFDVNITGKEVADDPGLVKFTANGNNLNVNVTGIVNAGITGNLLGTDSIASSNNVIITSSNGKGEIEGGLSTNSNSLSIVLNTPLTIQNVKATQGKIAISVPSLTVLNSGLMSSPQDINLTTNTFTNNGKITSSTGNVTIAERTDSLGLSGLIVLGTGSINANTNSGMVIFTGPQVGTGNLNQIAVTYSATMNISAANINFQYQLPGVIFESNSMFTANCTELYVNAKTITIQPGAQMSAFVGGTPTGTPTGELELAGDNINNQGTIKSAFIFMRPNSQTGVMSLKGGGKEIVPVNSLDPNDTKYSAGIVIQNDFLNAADQGAQGSRADVPDIGQLHLGSQTFEVPSTLASGVLIKANDVTVKSGNTITLQPTPTDTSGNPVQLTFQDVVRFKSDGTFQPVGTNSFLDMNPLLATATDSKFALSGTGQINMPLTIGPTPGSTVPTRSVSIIQGGILSVSGQSLGDFTVQTTANQNLKIGNIKAISGRIGIKSLSNVLQVATNVTLTAPRGIQIQNQNPNGFLVLNNNADLISNGNAQIYLAIGPTTPTITTSQTTPFGLTVSPPNVVGKQVFFQGVINGPSAAINVNSSGKVILVNQGTGNAAITLDPAVDITINPIAFVETEQPSFERIDGLDIWQKPSAGVSELLVNSQADTIIRIDNIAVGLKKGSAILLRSSANGLELYHLRDEKDGNIAIECGSNVWKLAAGQAIFRGSGEPRVAIRARCNLAGSLRIHEFSFPSLFCASPLMKVMADAEGTKERRMFKDILKLQSAVQVLGANKTPYTISRQSQL